ncbi:MAG: glycosyltransferase family 39 protein, partial [Ilumatobacteraceae bacterium]
DARNSYVQSSGRNGDVLELESEYDTSSAITVEGDRPRAARLWMLRPRLALGGICALSLVLNTWRLNLNGLGNQYYTAATRAMASSWHNWFFVALDRGGFISVDKPPVPLWITSLSARLFGISTWSVLLPSALAGTAAVAMLWIVVRRQFGVVAASIAALVLAISPVNVAVNRLNLPEPWLVLLLLAAVWAIQNALDSPHAARWLVLGGCMVGLAFNTKMLAAYLVVPGLGLAILFGTRGWLERLWRGFVFGMATLISSLPWILIVDAVPGGSRPFVGGSTDNTVLELIFGYNGLGRVNGGGIPAGAVSGPGGVFGGQPGLLRMFGSALGGQIAWLAPLAAVGLVAGLWLHRRLLVPRAAVIMWGLWVVVTAIVFSSAQGTFHAYYTALLGPGVAALVGIGAASLVSLTRRDPRWWYAVVAATAGTVTMELAISTRQADFYGWSRWVLVAAIIGAMGVAGSAVTADGRTSRRLALAAAAIAMAAVLVTPALWAGSETANAALNATLPQAGPRRGIAGRTFGSILSNGDPALATFLEAHDTGQRWQLVTTSAQQAAGLMADQGLSVMALGGFMGTDPAASTLDIGRMIAAGQVRYFMLSGFRQSTRGGFGAIAVMGMARSACTPVEDLDLPATYRGQLYDCAGQAAAFIDPQPSASVR